MGMTPADVEQKTFSTALRGYDLDEVDDFLDDVVSTIRELQGQIVEARAEPSAQQPATPADESAIGRALVKAQTTGDTMIADAQKEADQIRAEAKSEADSWAEERDAKKADVDKEMAELTTHVSGVRRQLAVLATAVADRLDEMDEAIGNNGEIDSQAELSLDAMVDGAQPVDDEASGDIEGLGTEGGEPSDEIGVGGESDEDNDETDDENKSSTKDDDTDQ